MFRVTGTSEDDEPLVQSCVQDTALDSVGVDLTVNDTDEEAVVIREDAIWWSVVRKVSTSHCASFVRSREGTPYRRFCFIV